jgi:hypothetical protein
MVVLLIIFLNIDGVTKIAVKTLVLPLGFIVFSVLIVGLIAF